MIEILSIFNIFSYIYAAMTILTTCEMSPMAFSNYSFSFQIMTSNDFEDRMAFLVASQAG